MLMGLPPFSHAPLMHTPFGVHHATIAVYMKENGLAMKNTGKGMQDSAY